MGFPWAVVGELAFVVYIYAATIGRGDWRRFYLGITYWAWELLWEIVNGLFGWRFGAPLFGVAGHSAYVIYRGINIEISLLFAVAPLALFHLLDEEKKARPVQRWKLPVLAPCALGVLCVGVEVLLHFAGALIWTYWWWNWPFIFVILIGYCAWFLLLTWHYERTTEVPKARNTLLFSLAFLVVCHLVFKTWLGLVGPVPANSPPEPAHACLTARGPSPG